MVKGIGRNEHAVSQSLWTLVAKSFETLLKAAAADARIIHQTCQPLVVVYEGSATVQSRLLAAPWAKEAAPS